jgi:hypothetical protein
MPEFEHMGVAGGAGIEHAHCHDAAKPGQAWHPRQKPMMETNDHLEANLIIPGKTFFTQFRLLLDGPHSPDLAKIQPDGFVLTLLMVGMPVTLANDNRPGTHP